MSNNGIDEVYMVHPARWQISRLSDFGWRQVAKRLPEVRIGEWLHVVENNLEAARAMRRWQYLHQPGQGESA